MYVNDAILAGLKFLNGVDETLTPAERLNFAIQYAQLMIMGPATPIQSHKSDMGVAKLVKKKYTGQSIDSIIQELERQQKEDSDSWEDGSGENNPSAPPF